MNYFTESRRSLNAAAWWQKIMLSAYVFLWALHVILWIAAPYYGVGSLSHAGITKLTDYNKERLSGYYHAFIGAFDKRAIQNKKTSN
jgi:hypothetical protein